MLTLNHLRCICADTVADAMIVEATAFESATNKGRMRVRAFFLKAVGMVVGGIMASVLPNIQSEDWALDLGQCFLLQVRAHSTVHCEQAVAVSSMSSQNIRPVFHLSLYFHG